MIVIPRLGRRYLAAREPLRDVIPEALEPDPLPPPRPVEEKVGGDPVQPALEGTRSVTGEGTEDPDEDLLGQVLRVMLVAGEPVGEAVHPGRMRAHDLIPAGRRPLGLCVLTTLSGDRRFCHQ